MIRLKALLTEAKTGRPFRGVVYRGDDKQFVDFDYGFIGKSTGANTFGFWFTDSPEAAEFYGQHVRAFEITMDNPLIVTEKEFVDAFPDGPPKFAIKAAERGYDGVIIQDITDGDRQSTVYCVWDKDQISYVPTSNPSEAPGGTGST
jgi:hypothetical protein